jgi:Na+-translocating ferredoxin:NAD+ oxidoreductase subunit G
MNESAKMFSVLVGVTAVCGLLLAAAHDITHERIALQQLRYIVGPAIRTVLADATNDPLVDRKVVSVADSAVTLFFEKKDSLVTGVALETVAQGYGGPVHIITGFEPGSGKCKSIAVAGAIETPGVGARIAETSFTGSFAGLELTAGAALRKDGGTIDGISGATISSRAVCSAVAKAQKLFTAVRPSLQGEEK